MDTAMLGAAAGMYNCGCAMMGVGKAFTAGAGAVGMSWGVRYSCALMLVSEVTIASGEDEGLTCRNSCADEC